ncbi:hypothetical protein V5799_034028 [Amblyomma americanum]|uniref:Myosin tail domain-containing protein n=1 Tax=Amblyomma americanum TaxID=6943 RepID=A0AAQ4DLM6_AMBAM
MDAKNQGEQASPSSSDKLDEGPQGYESQATNLRHMYAQSCLSELDVELPSASLASSGWDFALKVLKAQNERDVQAREELFKLECKAVARHVRALEEQLRDEKMLRSSTLSGCKKLEAGIDERSRQIVLLGGCVGEVLREVEKLEGSAKHRQQELEEARASRQELGQQAIAARKRVKDLKSQRDRVSEELAPAERACRTAQAERDELQEDIANATRQMSLLRGDMKILEAKLLAMEKKLGDERNKTRMLTDAMREVKAQADQLTGELVAERSASKRFADKAFVHERQCAELRAELQKVEESRKAEQRAVAARLEERLAQASDLLHQTEEGNRTAARTMRQMERLLEFTRKQVEDERRRAEELKEDEDAFNSRARELKAALDDAKPQHSQEKERRLKLLFELQEARKVQEKLASDLAAWSSRRQSEKLRKLH